MKKILLIVLGAILCINAQSQSFQKGNNLIKFGYGFPTIIGSLFNTYENYQDYNINNLGPLYIKYEHAITEKIGIGINVAYTSNEANYIENINGSNYKSTVSRTSWSALARLNFHFVSNDKLDAYFGPGVGYRNSDWKFSTESPNGNSNISFPTFIPFGLDFTIGANYYLNDNIGVFAEAGIAKSPIQLGIVGKF